MKIYQVEFIGMDDNIYSNFYTDKKLAEQRIADLKKKEDYKRCKQVFDLSEFSLPVTKIGIMEMLNRRFFER